MSHSNLPPGVSASDIPGNSQADIDWEHMLDALEAAHAAGRLSSTEILSRCGIELDWLDVLYALDLSGLTAAEIRERCGV